MPRDERIPDFTPTDNHFAAIEHMGPEATLEERQRATRAGAHELVC